MAEGLRRRIPLPEQMELPFDWRDLPLPRLMNLREFVAEMERQYGDRLDLRALRAALGKDKRERTR